MKVVEVQNNLENFQKNINLKLETVQSSVDAKVGQSIKMQTDSRGEVVSIVVKQLNQLIEEKLKLEITKVNFDNYINEFDTRINQYLQEVSQIESNLILRINQGDTHLYNWVLEQLMTVKGCLTDRQALVEQLVSFSTELRVKLDTAPCVQPSEFKPWNPLPAAEPIKALPSSSSEN